MKRGDNFFCSCGKQCVTESDGAPMRCRGCEEFYAPTRRDRILLCSVVFLFVFFWTAALNDRELESSNRINIYAAVMLPFIMVPVFFIFSDFMESRA